MKKISDETRKELREFAKRNRLSAVDEEMAEVWSRNLISRHIYLDDKGKQAVLSVAERLLSQTGKGLPWSDFEVLCAKTLFGIVKSKNEVASLLEIAGRRTKNSTDDMFKKRMFFFTWLVLTFIFFLHTE